MDRSSAKMTTSRRKPSQKTPPTFTTANAQNDYPINDQLHQSSRSSTTKASTFNDVSSTAYETISSKNRSSTSRLSPLLPTTLELAFLSIFPLTLFLGTLYSHISPQTRSSTYDTSFYSSSSSSASPLFSTSTENAAVLSPSYFAQKRNIFNLYFVKIGWFWTTAALAAFGSAHPYFSNSETQSVNKNGNKRADGTASNLAAGEKGGALVQRRKLQLAIRYIIATAWWIGVTRWFFGPPLIDRSFRWTGGACEALILQEAADANGKTLAGGSPLGSHDGSQARLTQKVEVYTAAECKAAGGQWQGGHDVSGHVFMLCLSCAVIAFEVLPVLFATRREQKQRKSGDVTPETSVSLSSKAPDASASSSSSSSKPIAPASTGSERSTSSTPSSAARLATRFALAVAALSWWMLLMTAVFFHTWFEKFTGLVLALAAIWSVYIMPRAFWKEVIGVPER